MNSKYAGWQICYDAHVEPVHANLLNDQEFLKLAVLDLIQATGLTLLEGPFVKIVPVDPGKLWSDDNEGGISVVCMITGHVALYAWPVRQRFSVDIFSCKPFDPEEVESFIKERFHVAKRWMHTVPRIWSDGEFNPDRAVEPTPKMEIPPDFQGG